MLVWNWESPADRQLFEPTRNDIRIPPLSASHQSPPYQQIPLLKDDDGLGRRSGYRRQNVPVPTAPQGPEARVVVGVTHNPTAAHIITSPLSTANTRSAAPGSLEMYRVLSRSTGTADCATATSAHRSRPTTARHSPPLCFLHVFCHPFGHGAVQALRKILRATGTPESEARARNPARAVVIRQVRMVRRVWMMSQSRLVEADGCLSDGAGKDVA